MKTRMIIDLIHRRARQRWGSRDGAVLGMVMIILLLVASLGLLLLSLSERNSVETGRSLSAEQAFWAAEAGLAHVKAIAAQPVPFDDLYLVGNGVVTGSVNNGSYSVDIQDVSVSGYAEKHYDVTSHGISAGGAVRTLKMHGALQVAGASYAMASGSDTTPDGKNNFYGWYDWVDGPVRINSQFNIVGPNQQTTLKPLVSWAWPAISTADSVYYAGNIKNDSSVFWHTNTVLYPPDDPILGAQPINIGAISDVFANLSNSATASGYVTQGVVCIRFETNRVRLVIGTNTYVRTNALAGAWNYYMVYGSVTGVQGVVQGNVVLLATNVITISSNIIYNTARGANDPWSGTFDTNQVADRLVMSARQAVVVEADPGKVNQVSVHSAILVPDDASGGANDVEYGFCAKRYNDPSSGAGQPVIQVYGTISQYRRGLTGPKPSGASDEPPPNKGFGLHVKFDGRFLQEGLFGEDYTAYWWDQWTQVPP